MNCIKCGKEIPDGENDICEECKSNNEEIVEEKVENVEVVETTEEVKEEIEKEAEENKEENKEENNEVTEDVAAEDSNEKTEKKKGKINVIIAIICIVACVVIFLLGMFADSIPLFTLNDVGNTVGNILNSGYAVEDKNFIYYIAPDSELVDICIYKADKDGKNIKELYKTSDTLISLNAVGNDLFFLSLSPEYDNDGNTVINNKICRISKDGEDYQVINDNEFHDYCYEIYVLNNRVYYIGEDVKVYNMDLYGGDRTLVLDKERGYVAITKDYIIYNDYINEEENLENFETFLYNVKTGRAEVISKGQKTYSTTIIGNEVYYTDETGVIYKKNINNLGAEATKICETEAYYMNATKDGIYYMNYTDENAQTISIFRVNLDGSDNKVIKTLSSPDGADFINIVGDWVLYTDSDGKDLFMNLTDKNDGQTDVRVFNLNISEYWQKFMAEEGSENVDDSISLDTTVEDVEKVENSID